MISRSKIQVRKQNGSGTVERVANLFLWSMPGGVPGTIRLSQSVMDRAMPGRGAPAVRTTARRWRWPSPPSPEATGRPVLVVAARKSRLEGWINRGGLADKKIGEGCAQLDQEAGDGPQGPRASRRGRQPARNDPAVYPPIRCWMLVRITTSGSIRHRSRLSSPIPSF